MAARITEPPIRPRPSTHTGGLRHGIQGWHIDLFTGRAGWRRLLVKAPGRGLALAPMGAQRAPAQTGRRLPDGFGVAVVREDGKWRCSPMRPAALTSLAAAETELRELRSAGAVFGLLDVDDEFFVIVRPAPAGTRLLLSDATAALDYDIAAEVLEKLDADIDPDDLEDADPFEEGDLGVLSDIGLPEAVLGVIISTRRPLRRRAARAGSRGRWASPTSCRRCSTDSIGDRD